MSCQLVTGDAVIAFSQGKRKASAGRCERLKSKAGQQARRTDVPRIRNDKRSFALMQRPESSSFFFLIGHIRYPFVCGIAATPSVPATTSTKFLSSRRISLCACAVAKFAL